jgi:DNA-binding MarR family transcriptional regulator
MGGVGHIATVPPHHIAHRGNHLTSPARIALGSPCTVEAYAHIREDDIGEQMRMPTSGEANMSGLPLTQYPILAQFATRSELPTLTELADAMVTDTLSLGHTLRPLVRDGYVALRRGETDRRTQRIALTDRSHNKFRESLTYWQTAQGAFVSLYGDKGQRASGRRF